MKALFSLRGADFDEMRVGVASVVRTLGPAAATGAILFATRRHLAALARGEGAIRSRASGGSGSSCTTSAASAST